MNKFKAGDKIVIVKKDWEGFEVGTVSFVRSVGDQFYDIANPVYPTNLEEDYPFSEDELEFEEVYSSPLYKALNEL